jgi:glycosyltransferase involved in cell wall biosynthesis
MKRIIVEGWRFSFTSYAVLNQFQCLEILKRPGIELYHRDLPFHMPDWPWIPGLLRPEQEAKIKAIPQPPPGMKADALIRIVHPTDTAPSPHAERTYIWAVTEFKIMEDSRMVGGLTARQSLTRPGLLMLTCSNWSKTGLVVSGADPSRVWVVPCGIDPDIYKPPTEAQREADRKARGWGDKFVILNVSTLVWSKGVGALLQVFARVAQMMPNAILAIKGSDQLLRSGKRLNDFLGVCPPDMAALLRSRIHYIGESLSFDDLARVYGAADVYFAPYHAEGFNLPALEAAACGCPLVVTQGGPTDDFTDPSFALQIQSREMAHPEVTKNHGADGRVLVVDGDQAIRHLLRVSQDAMFRAQARVAGPAFVRAGFTWDKVVDKLLAIVTP